MDEEARQRLPSRRTSKRSRSLVALLGAPCRVREVVVGEVAAVLVDARRARVIGLDIVDPDGVHRFLPWVVADLGADGVSVRSSFLLVDESDLYTRLRAQQIADPTELAELHVDRSGRLVGEAVTVSTAPAAGTSIG